MGGLVKYDAALNAIAEAKAVDELLGIRDTADALRAAARVANNKQAEIDMAEIRFRAERRVGEMMAAQRDTVGLAPAGRKKIGSEGDPIPSLSEVGIDKHLADRARKLAAIPRDEFDGIVGDWRGRVEQENTRVTVNLLKAGDRAEQGRRENDFYPTPVSLVAEVVSRWRPISRIVWEPCAGDGRFAEALRGAGFEVLTGDIAEGVDFFALTEPPKPGVALCTNPPFERVREFIDHAFAIGIREMCLVLPERLWACGEGRKQFDRYRPALWVNMDWREDYLGKGGSPDRALAVAIWTSPCAESCTFDVWTRQAETGEIIEGDDVTPEAVQQPRDRAAPYLAGADLEPHSDAKQEPVRAAPPAGDGTGEGGSSALPEPSSAKTGATVPDVAADQAPEDVVDDATSGVTEPFPDAAEGSGSTGGADVGDDGAQTVAPAQGPPTSPAGSEAVEIPATQPTEGERIVAEMIAQRKALRPHCLNPRNCGGEGHRHCWNCQKAHADANGEAA